MNMRAHIIGKQFFSVNYGGKKGAAMAVQRDISQLYREQILPRMDALFSRFAGDDSLIRIDRLEIDLGAFHKEKLETQLGERLLRALEETLRHQIRQHFDAEEKSEVEIIDSPQRTEEVLLFFLEKGYMPWNALKWTVEELEVQLLREVTSRPALIKAYRRLLLAHPLAQKRLLLQFTPQTLNQLLQIPAGQSLLQPLAFANCWVEELQNYFPGKIASSRLQQSFWEHWLTAWLADARGESLRQMHWFSPLLHSTATLLAIPLQQLISQLLEAWTHPHPTLAASGWQLPLLRFIQEAIKNKQQGFTSLHGKPLRARIERLLHTLRQADTKPEHDQAGPSEGPIATPQEEGESPSGIPQSRPASGAEGNQHPASGQREVPEEKGKQQQQEGSKESIQPESTYELPKREDRQITRPEMRYPLPRQGEEIYVDHAGIVILHPFLPTLFESLGLVQHKEFVNEAARERAIHLLAYLARGTFQLGEPAMSLHKLLCGMPIGQPVDRFPVLSQAEQEECDHLLQAVVGHWSALKDSSIDALRANFLMREGKLTHKESGWKLQVEQKVYDLLLSRLPWGIGIIRLPWMPEMLQVEWA